MQTTLKEFTQAEEIKRKIYKGVRSIPEPHKHPRGKCLVTVDGIALKSIGGVNECTPTFEWGWGRGTACTNLAESILFENFKEEYITLEMIIHFRETFIAGLSFDGWEKTELDIDLWADNYERMIEKNARTTV